MLKKSMPLPPNFLQYIPQAIATYLNLPSMLLILNLHRSDYFLNITAVNGLYNYSANKRMVLHVFVTVSHHLTLEGLGDDVLFCHRLNLLQNQLAGWLLHQSWQTSGLALSAFLQACLICSELLKLRSTVTAALRFSAKLVWYSAKIKGYSCANTNYIYNI